MQFSTTAINVLIMLAYAVPGYILVKVKAVKPDSIPAFARVLLYVCQPCLSIYSFQKVTYSPELFANMGIFAGLNMAIMLVILGLSFLLCYRQYKTEEGQSFRACTIAACLGNVGFLGVPLLEALLPEYPEAVSFSAMFIVCMNILSWTICSMILTGDKKYLSVKKIFLNPPVLTLFITLPLFFTKTAIPEVVLNPITLLGKMTAPLCMLIMGMRFATVRPKELFPDWRLYATASVKLIVMPLLAFLITHWLPVDYSIKATIVILCSCPTASVVLSLAEMYRTAQKTAANLVLTGTLFSMVTIPLILLIL